MITTQSAIENLREFVKYDDVAAANLEFLIESLDESNRVVGSLSYRIHQLTSEVHNMRIDLEARDPAVD